MSLGNSYLCYNYSSPPKCKEAKCRHFAILSYINENFSYYLLVIVLFMAGVGVSPNFLVVNGPGILSLLQQGVSVIEVIRSWVFILYILSLFITIPFIIIAYTLFFAYRMIKFHFNIYFRIFSHAKNEFNYIKEEFLRFELSRGGDLSPDQNTRCTCSYTSFDQPLCSENI